MAEAWTKVDAPSPRARRQAEHLRHMGVVAQITCGRVEANLGARHRCRQAQRHDHLEDAEFAAPRPTLKKASTSTPDLCAATSASPISAAWPMAKVLMSFVLCPVPGRRHGGCSRRRRAAPARCGRRRRGHPHHHVEPAFRRFLQGAGEGASTKGTPFAANSGKSSSSRSGSLVEPVDDDEPRCGRPRAGRSRRRRSPPPAASP